MGGKKKAGKSKKTAAENKNWEEENQKFLTAQKLKQQEQNIQMPSRIEQKISEIKGSAERFCELNQWEPLGPQPLQVLAESTKEANQTGLQQIRMWKAEIQDEGVRNICNLMLVNQDVRTLELLDCDLTSLSCQFVAKVLSKPVADGLSGLRYLRLDHNDMGDAGMTALAKGLNMNNFLELLSITQCRLTEQSADAFFEIFIFKDSKLKELNLMGNAIKASGLCRMFQALTINKALEKLDVADNQIVENQDLADHFKLLLRKNTSLGSINLKQNMINTIVGHAILEMLSGTDPVIEHLSELDLPSKMNKELMDKIFEKTKSKKGKKKGMGMGMKKK